jgi:hypothetical protein
MGIAAGLQNALAELFSCVTTIEVIDGNVRTDCSLLESNGSVAGSESIRTEMAEGADAGRRCAKLG